MNETESPETNVTLSEFQTLIRNMYLEKDQTRGVPATFMWLMEEVGELASSLRATTPSEQSRIPPIQWQDRR